MNQIEPKEAFPYTPPSEEIKQNYRHIFQLKEPLAPRYIKDIFDKILSIILFLFTIPI